MAQQPYETTADVLGEELLQFIEVSAFRSVTTKANP